MLSLFLYREINHYKVVGKCLLKSKFNYNKDIFEYVAFFVFYQNMSTEKCIQKKYKTMHCHNTTSAFALFLEAEEASSSSLFDSPYCKARSTGHTHQVVTKI